ncbi:uncharacterized protein LOC143294718 [Babylonia areolata]|uniref:uncharacterized protein LOC143294718 n=1 Tax=Babylonia areolata TaxID=304850 RepID=UPI003FD1B885
MPQLYLKEVEPFIVSHKNGKRSKGGDSALSSIGEQKVYNRRTTKRSTSLIATDALLLCLEFFQILAVLQAMSLKWIWPKSWIRTANFIFLFNVDVWEFIKVDCGAFVGARNYDTPSDTVSTKFYYILTGWASFFIALMLIWAVIRIVLHLRKPAYLLVHVARLHRAMIIIIQIMALPFGMSAFKVFHCTSDGKVSVDNSLECWSGYHWVYVVPVVVGVVVLMVVFPAWLVWRIRHEAMASTAQHHEDFLKLKEVEYMSGLDVVWTVHAFHLFSSFRLRAIYYRPLAHLVKLLVLVLYAATFQSIRAQAISMVVVLLLLALLILAVRPYRLTAFNVAMAMGYFCLSGDALFGAVLTQYDPTEVLSPWLVEPYSVAILISLNAVLLLGTVVVFLLFLLGYRLCCQGRCVLEPLWPVMTAYECEVEGVETQKYLAAVLRGRAVIERCRRLPAMFAPVHEMSHQIHVLNAYMRESELMQDGLHPTLWAVLDEMIDMYQRLEPKSLFGEMVQESIRKNAAHFMTLMPVFAQRLAQRDYDLILVPPLKKRLLLKMYIIAMWLDGSRRRKTHHELTQKVLTSIWEGSPEVVTVEEEREYHEDLYPGTVQGPETEALFMTGTLDLGRGLYDLEAVEEEEESLSSFLKRVPPTLVLKEEDYRNQDPEVEEESGADNPGFVPDDDDDSSKPRSSQTLTTAEIHDTSEAPPDIVVDLEAAGRAGYPGEGETTVTLTDYRAEETNTDEPSQPERDEDPQDDSTTSDGHHTSTSSKSVTSAKPRTQSPGKSHAGEAAAAGTSSRTPPPTRSRKSSGKTAGKKTTKKK